MWVKTSDAVYSSPVVKNGVVYFGSNDTHLYAVDTASGDLRWRFETEDPVRSSPAVAGGVVYFGGSDDGHLYALNATNGELLWKYEAGPNGSVSSPTVANGVVYFGPTQIWGFVFSDSYRMYALNASNGNLLWIHNPEDFVESSPAVAEDVVYFGSEDRQLYALDAVSGKLLWTYKTGNASFTSPAIAEGVVYVGSGDNHLYALDASIDELVWRYETEDSVNSSPAVANGIVYFGSNDDHLYAVATSAIGKHGSTSANFTTPASPSTPTSTPTSSASLNDEITPTITPLPVHALPTEIHTVTVAATSTLASATKVRINQGEVRPVVQVSQGRSAGTGFVIDTNYVVTNAHVVSRQGDVSIELHDGSGVDGVVVSRGSELRFEENRCIWWEDMALIRTNKPMMIATKLNLDRAVRISRGDAVEVYGYPEGHQSSRAKRIDNMRIESFASVGIDLKPMDGTENQVQDGASGSPVVHSGEVIGMVVGTCWLEGRGFVRDPNRIRTIPTSLIVEWINEVAPDTDVPKPPTPVPTNTPIPTPVPRLCENLRQESWSDGLFEDCKALIQAKPTLEGDGRVTLDWTLDLPIENWYGVSIENGRVRILNLTGLVLQGRVPAILGELDLTHFYMEPSSFGTHCIPSALRKVRYNNISAGRWCD